MDRNNAINVLETIDRMRPPYVEWRVAQAKKLAAAHATTEREELRAMIDSFARTLADVETAEAAAVVEGMELGRIAMPFWSELATAIRSAVLDDRQGRRAVERIEREKSPRYKCLHCQDSGAVKVYYPLFVEWVRPRFEAYQASGFPLMWFEDAAGEWYVKLNAGDVKGPAEISLACCCSGDNARIYQRQVDAMRETRGTQKPKRAAHVGVWNPDRQQLSTGLPEDELAEWYASHAAYEWTPNEGEYDARFN